MLKTLVKLIFGKSGYFSLIYLAHRKLYKKIIAGVIKRLPNRIALFSLNKNLNTDNNKSSNLVVSRKMFIKNILNIFCSLLFV